MSRIKGGDNIISAASTGLKKLREMLDRQISEANTARQQSEVEQHGQTLKGYHYSKAGENLDRLSGEKYGTGMPGEELMRVMQPQNDDIRSRVYFYPDPKTPAGKANNTPGMRTPEPESGVGPQIYRVKVPGVYDLKADPLKLRAAFGSDRSGLEREIKRRGFTGYVNPTSGAAVALVDELPAQKLGPYRPDVETALKAEQRMQNPFLVTAEMVPSTKTPLGDALVKAPLPLRKEYTDRKAEILYDTTYGPAPVGDVRGTSAFPGYGTFEGNLNPNVILRVSGPNKAKRLADSSGGLAQQDAVPFMRPDFDNPPSADTPVGVRVTTRGGVGPQEMGEIFAETGEDMTRSALDQLEFVNFRGADNNEFVDNVANYFINRNIASDINPYSLDPRGSYNETGDQWARFGRDPTNPGAVPPAMEDTVGRIEDLDREFKKRLGVAGAAGATTAALIGAGGTVAPEQVQAGVISNIPAAGRTVVNQFGRNFDPRFDDRVKEQSRLESLILDVAQRPTQDAPYLSFADLEGRPFITSMSDRTRAGGELVGINGVPLRDPVNLQGGQDFMFENPGQVWASNPGPAGAILNAARKAAAPGENPLFLPWRMTPTGQDFATMSGEAMIQYAASNMGKGDKRSLNAAMKRVIPGWPGIDNPEAIAAYRSAPKDLRDAFANVMDVQFRNRGGLSIGEARLAVADPNQVAARDMGLQNVGEVFPDQPRIVDSGHPSYGVGVPGQGVGRLAQDVGVLELLPDVVRERGIPDPLDYRATDMRSMQFNVRSGRITEDLLRSLEARGVDVNSRVPSPRQLVAGTGAALVAGATQAAAPLPIQEQSEFQRRQTARAPVMTQLRTASLEVASTALRGLEAVGQQISAGIEALNNSPFVMPMVKPDNMMAGLEALDMPLQGLYGLAAGGIALGQGDDVTSALDRAANVARQPLEQTAYDVGGAVTDATGSPGLGAAANVLTLSPDLIMAGKALPGGLKRLGVLAR
jgi:hypothetical protein